MAQSNDDNNNEWVAAGITLAIFGGVFGLIVIAAIVGTIRRNK